MSRLTLIVVGCFAVVLGCTTSMPFAWNAGVAHAGSLTDKEVADMLAHHNALRADIDVGPLRWSNSLANFAGAWANSLAAKRCKLQHRTDSPHGENLFMGTATHYGVVDAGKAWAKEKQFYAGGALTESNWYQSGHYTQMVWRNTVEVGCAKALCNDNMIVVCNYDPPGNFLGQKPY